jgi:DNA-binding MurR/RpiR family transcriptional regulator
MHRRKTVAPRREKRDPKHQETLRPVLAHPHEYVLLSLRGLARSLNKDPATLLRIIRDMGFDGYKEFQRHLHQLSIAHATPFQIMKGSEQSGGGLVAHLEKALQGDMRNLQALQALGHERIAALAGRFHRAKRLAVIGGDQASALVFFLAYNLTLLGLPTLSGTMPGEVLHLTRTSSRGDVLVAISFGRGLRQTVEGISQAKRKGAYTIGITDTYLSPLAAVAHESLLTSIESPAFGGSYVAPMALLNLLLVACAHHHRRRTLAHLREAEREQETGFRWYRDEE